MSSLLDVPLGVMEPQILLLPADVVSLAAAEEAIELADAYGVAGGYPLDGSQQITLRAGLGERADGSWAASTVADFEPRQNGKNDTCNARELAGLILFGERLIIHTAHEFSTANESFLRLVAVFEAWDDLRKRVARIRYANGEQGIELLSGQRLKYRARTGGAGRGFAQADLVVYDEAQHLQAEHVAASGPARLANPNSQGWYMGSGGLATSANAWRLRRRALSGEQGRLAYVEHTAERVRLVGTKIVSEHPDIMSRGAWAQANSAYGTRISDESLLGLLGEIGPELWQRECLCIWDPELGDVGDVFPAGAWESCADPLSEIVGTPSLVVSLSPNQSSVSLFAAGKRRDGKTHVEVVRHGRPGQWFIDDVAAISRRQNAQVLLHPGHPAGALLPALAAAGVSVGTITSPDYTAGCGAFYAAVIDGTLRYRPPQLELDEAISRASQKRSGETWKWTGEDISALVAATQAVWAANNTTQGGWMVAIS